jgi:hypothetical protein
VGKSSSFLSLVPSWYFPYHISRHFWYLVILPVISLTVFQFISDDAAGNGVCINFRRVWA